LSSSAGSSRCVRRAAPAADWDAAEPAARAMVLAAPPALPSTSAPIAAAAAATSAPPSATPSPVAAESPVSAAAVSACRVITDAAVDVVLCSMPASVSTGVAASMLAETVVRTNSSEVMDIGGSSATAAAASSAAAAVDEARRSASTSITFGTMVAATITAAPDQESGARWSWLISAPQKSPHTTTSDSVREAADAGTFPTATSSPDCAMTVPKSSVIRNGPHGICYSTGAGCEAHSQDSVLRLAARPSKHQAQL
jgi:hypothetical protein